MPSIELLLPFLLMATAGWLVWMRVRDSRRILTRAEYWIYTPGIEVPEETAVMDQMMHRSEWPRAINTRERTLFSDIRLHVANVTRKANPHVFRPDLLEASDPMTPELLSALAGCQGMIRVEYLSTKALADRRHLKFLPHMAYAYAVLTAAPAILDERTGQVRSLEAFRRFLDSTANLESQDANVRVIFAEALEDGVARTLGMGKAGLRELVSLPVPHDQRNLALEMVEKLAAHYWHKGKIEPFVELDNDFDHFLLHTRRRGTEIRVRILRVVPDPR